MKQLMYGTCAVHEQFGDGSPQLKLQTNRPLYYVRDRLREFSQDEIADVYEKAVARWGEVCDVKTRRIMSLDEAGPDDVVNVITVADLGGGGVLADQRIPHPGGRFLQMRINERIAWTVSDGRTQGLVDLLRVIAHEFGHFLGVLHFPVELPPELMEPRISHIIAPQPTEARLVRGWFGPPRVEPEPTPTPEPKPQPTPNGGSIMSAILEFIIKMAAKAVLPILREYVKQTDTPLDDLALDVIERTLRDQGFIDFAKANQQLVQE